MNGREQIINDLKPRTNNYTFNHAYWDKERERQRERETEGEGEREIDCERGKEGKEK